MVGRKKILLTNDDGMGSPGLETLLQELFFSGRFDLRVVAPAQEQSGVGHAITLHNPLLVERVTLPGNLEPLQAFRVFGTPADCVKIAITNLFTDFKPDLVIAGINRGPNVGINVVYSGTVAGALEACICGFPALAVSLDIPSSGGLWHFRLAAELATPLIHEILEKGLPPWTILNMNIPNRPKEMIRGVRLAKHGRSGFQEYYVEEPCKDGMRRFRLEGEMVFRDEDGQVDAVALREGWVTVSALGVYFGDARGEEAVRDWSYWGG